MKNDKDRPETIENRWDILYRDYPEVYDEFSMIPRKPSVPEVLDKTFNLRDRVVLDIGSGTGLSTFGIAAYAKHVIGIEPEDAMLEVAIRRLESRGTTNVEFLKGKAENIPLEADSVGMASFVTSLPTYDPEISKMEENARVVINEAARVVRTGGLIVSVDIAPFWYGGELGPVILGRSRRTPEDIAGKLPHILIEKLCFKHKDFYQVQEYGSVEKTVAIYGFIYGREAIDYLRKHRKTSIKWKFRIYYSML